MKSVFPLYLGEVLHEVREVLRMVSRQTTTFKGLGECFGTFCRQDREMQRVSIDEKWQRD